MENIYEEYEEHKTNGYAQSNREENVRNKKTVIKRKYIYVNELEYGRRKVNVAEMEENKGFNDEKHHGLAMNQAYSYHENAVKCHYGLMLIAHQLMQLLEHYMKTQDNAKKIKEIGKEIKEALRYTHT